MLNHKYGYAYGFLLTSLNYDVSMYLDYGSLCYIIISKEMGNLRMIHAFENNGYYIVLDVNSGSIHSVDEMVYDILKAFPNSFSIPDVIQKFNGKYDEDSLRQACEEIKELEKEGLLYSPDLDEELLWAQLKKNNGVKALCLNIAHDCNLACKYCFASKGDYNTHRGLMSEEVACKALDFLAAHSGSRKNIEVDFFGGEPLLNFDVVKKAVAHGREIEKEGKKKFHFTITTNGTLLNDEIIDYINENMENVVISLDGRKEVNDAMRYYRGGQGSYDRIVPLAKKLVEARNGKQYYIRGTFTAKNIDFAEDVFYIADLGFREVSVEPVVGTGEPFHLREEHIPAILEEYDRLAKMYLDYTAEGNQLKFYHFNINLYNGPCVHRRVLACGAGFEYLAVSPEGYLYPCHQFVGQEEFIIGTVEEGIQNEEIAARFKNCNIMTKDECKNCWAKYFCSGGCHANAYFSNKNIQVPNELACILQRKRIECALMIETARAENE